jgi:hypothetical protein
MNERIKLIAEQAGFVIWGDESWNPGDVIDWSCSYDNELKKFAELIARECADICMEMAAKCAGLPGDGALAKDCADWIKNDFGVEE